MICNPAKHQVDGNGDNDDDRDDAIMMAKMIMMIMNMSGRVMVIMISKLMEHLAFVDTDRLIKDSFLAKIEV